MIPLLSRFQNRLPNALRKITFQVDIAPRAMGSVLISFGNTQVICAANIENSVPRWMKEQGVTGGWLTAEYSMLPYSTVPRKNRDSALGKIDGRSIEIQRLIGRSLRAAIDLEMLGSRTIVVDCDVLQADGGTRTAAITGASVAMALACEHLVRRHEISIHPMQKLVAAVSVGIVHSQAVLDLDYLEDRDAQVDLNLVMNESLEFIELQASGEENVFNNDQLASMLAYGREGISQLVEYQRSVLREHNIFIKKSS
ncbi:MAG: ribonuclease PH [Verrucomicrobiae bacterium]|jgi:ribonuclease PH|nr:ribonuclease PH [Verrucomicrobiae bacterium]